jgi:hypothetical protein
MDPYFLIDDVELNAMILDLSRQMGTSEANIASPDAGSVGYISARDAERKMAGLMRSWCSRRGIPYVGTSARYVVVRIAQECVE